MLHRYSAIMDFSTEVPEDFDLTASSDYDKISAWANESMRWAAYNRLITKAGIQGTWNPSGSTTEAQCVAILQRFVRVIEQE